MRLALSTWDPGATQEGGKGYTSWFIRGLIAHYLTMGHEVFWVQDGTPSCGQKLCWSYKDVDILKSNQIDVLLVMWRWPMPQVPDRHLAYLRQQQLISDAFSSGIRVIVHDQDHQVGAADAAYLSTRGAVLTAPELAPRIGFRKLMYATDVSLWPWPSNYRTFAGKERTAVYVGNNYRRFHQTQRLLGSDWFQTTFYGNWLKLASDRQSPEEILAAFPKGVFHDWVDQSQVLETIRTGFLTVHLAPPDYCDCGFMALRFIEAAKAGVLGLVPIEFVGADALPKALFVSTSDDVAYRLGSLTSVDYQYLLDAQRQFVAQESGFDQWDQILVQ